MADASEYLLEIGAHNGASVTTLRVSTSGFVTGPSDNPPDTEYPGLIKDPGLFRRSLFSEGRTLGASETSYGMIEVANASGLFDAWLGYGFDSRSCVLKRVANRNAAYGGAETLLRATVEGLDSSSALTSLRLRLYDRRLELDRPIQTNRYGGTTTSGGLPGALVDGNADLKDALKPLIFGRVQNVPAVPVNVFDLLYQVHDGAVSSIVVYDGGVQLSLRSNYASAAVLQAAAIPAGWYGVCLSAGLFRLGGSPNKAITADVMEAAPLNAASVAQRILARIGLTSTDDVAISTFNALAAAAPQEIGLFVGDDMTAQDALNQVLSSISGYILPNTAGAFEVGRLSASGAPTWSIGVDQIYSDGDIGFAQNPDTDKGLPAWRVVVRYGRLGVTQDDSGLNQCVSAAQRAVLAKEYREAKAEDASVKILHPLAPELTIDTLLVNAADAVAEAARRLALYGVRRDVITFPVRREDAASMPLGSSGTLTLPRFGYQAGRTMVVIGRTEDPAKELVTVTLWG